MFISSGIMATSINYYQYQFSTLFGTEFMLSAAPLTGCVASAQQGFNSIDCIGTELMRSTDKRRQKIVLFSSQCSTKLKKVNIQCKKLVKKQCLFFLLLQPPIINSVNSAELI